MKKNPKQKIKHFRIEYVVLFVFAITLLIISYFHEPWFDEAQAWQIARYASFKEMIFEIPHYEGHPQLWHLLLSVPAKCGVPFEIGLKSIGFIISIITVYVIEFKSPFPLPVRIVLPFTYFIFYQYGVIVRPYGLMILFSLLCAMTFKTKDQNPVRFVCLLFLLCLTGAYGIVISGGICISWIIDILGEERVNHIKNFLSDKRVICLIVLLICVMGIIYMILPYDNTYNAATIAENNKLIIVIIAIVTFITDSLITTSPWMNSDISVLQNNTGDYWLLLFYTLIALVIWFFIIANSKRGILKYVVIPYFLLSIFGGLVYFSAHHIGIVFVLVLFWLWINADEEDSCLFISIIRNSNSIKEKDIKIFHLTSHFIVISCLCVSLYWTVSSCVSDIEVEYSYGRNTAKFLQETGLDQLKVICPWIDNSENGEVDYTEMETELTGTAVPILAYSDYNFYYNVNDGKDIGFMYYRRTDAKKNKKNIERWSQKGIPDVLTGYVNVDLLTNGKMSFDDYAPVYKMNLNYVFKGKSEEIYDYVYVRRDLLVTLELKELETYSYLDSLIGK